MAGFRTSVLQTFDPLLVPLGFASGQGETGGILFCIAHWSLPLSVREVISRGDPDSVPTDECTDVIVEGDEHGLTSVHIDGVPLSLLLGELGLPDHTAALDAMPTGDLEQDLLQARVALQSFFVRLS